MSRAITLAGGFCLVLALVLGMAVPALAAPQAPAGADFEGEPIKGEVIAIGDQELVIRSGEEEITITVDEDTLYCRLPMAARLMTSVRQRLELRQQERQELRTQAENGQGQGLKNRIQVAVAAQSQTRTQNQISQTEGEFLPEMRCFRFLRPFGNQAELSDIAVGDSLVILADENNLAQKVLII